MTSPQNSAASNHLGSFKYYLSLNEKKRPFSTTKLSHTKINIAKWGLEVTPATPALESGEKRSHV